jgi:hypothetical protein
MLLRGDSKVAMMSLWFVDSSDSLRSGVVVNNKYLLIHITQNVIVSPLRRMPSAEATKSLRKATFSVSERCKMKLSSNAFCVLVPWWLAFRFFVTSVTNN